MDAPATRRNYNSPLRQGQIAATRNRILDAVASLMSDPGQPELTFSTLARHAEVSERTVYRHFRDKAELLEAFWSYINEQLGMAQYPVTVEELLEVLPSVYKGFDERAPLIRAHLTNSAGREMRIRVAPLRREIFWSMLKPHVKGLSIERQRWACGAVQLLFSPRAWASLEENWGFSGEESAAACAWAIRSLLSALASERNAALIRPHGRRS